jgi:glycosyltransferase involved in cell wall biosynthesis
LLSTFDGERFLAPLLDSLLGQDQGSVEILVRDDGSTDRTLEILRSRGLDAEQGEHVGFVRSFGRLLAGADADYVAFCDQDDVWLPDKLSRAVARLERVSGPALYCGRLAVVDEALQPLGLSAFPRRGLSFANALVESQAPGCTIVLNREARELAGTFPAEVVSHDWWLYLVLSAFGGIVYDEQPAILFRRHGRQTFGIGVGAIDTWRAKLTRGTSVLPQVRAFARAFGDRLGEEERRILERFLESSRLGYALRPDVYRQARRDDALLRAKLALGLI